MPQHQPETKLFRIYSLGDVTYEYAPSRASILEDLQRTGAIEKNTSVEEISEADARAEIAATKNGATPAPAAADTLAGATAIAPAGPADRPKEAKIFTLPDGQKVKDENGILFGLEWREYTKRDVMERVGCEDLEFPEGVQTLKILDWVELKPEGDNDASTTDSDV